MLTQCDHNQNSASAATHKSRKSKRWRTVCEQQTAEASHSLCGNDEQNSAVMVNEDLLVGTASHIDNSIMGDMPSNTISRRTRRMLRQCDRTENCAPTKVFFTSDESHQVISRKSKRWKAASQQPATEALDTFSGNHEQNVAAPINENLLVGTASHIDYSITEGTFYRESIFTFTWSGIISKNKASFDNKMEYVLIRDMQSYESEYKIKVRISRVWRAKKFNTDKDDGLQCVLVDEQGDAIHAIVTESDYPVVGKKFEQGKVYHISKFFTRKSHENYKILDHESQAYFNGKTVFEPVQECFPPIPEHRFYLVEFDQLSERMNDMTILTDVYGCLKSIVPVHQTTLTDREESKCEIYLQNLRRKELRITLWGHIARQIDIETIKKLPPPVLMALTSLKIKEYLEQPAPANTSNTCIFINPTIPEAMRYRIQFSKLVDRVQVRPIPSKQPTSEEIEENDVRTVSQLNTLDPSSYKEQMVYCSATISRFATHDSWWYKGCPRCYRELKQQEHINQLGCLQHGTQQIIPCFRVYMTIEDGDHEATVIIMGKHAEQLFGSTCKDLVAKRSYPTAETLPQEIEKTKGQKLLFQIQVKDTSELIVRAVFPDGKLLTPPPQKDPATATPDHPPFERKRLIEKGRKQLFISEPEKKPKSDKEAEKGGTTSSSSTREKKDN